MINRYLSILIDELRAEGIADPLAQSFTLAALWDDLATLVDEARSRQSGVTAGETGANNPPRLRSGGRRVAGLPATPVGAAGA